MILLFMLLIIIFLSFISVYKCCLNPVSNKNKNIEFSIKKGDTYSTIAPILEKKGLIKSSFFYKLYIKLNNPSELKVGLYKLNTNMDVKSLVNCLEKGTKYTLEMITYTIPEGWHFDEIADYTEIVTNNSKQDIINVWESDEFINKVINKYWFVTEDVKKTDIRYALEGYFFPSTYYFINKDVKPDVIAFKMLDQMENILNKYKDKISSSNYTVHEILTMASIIEHEAILDKERAKIASVFYNRLNNDMLLQSCATLGYATGKWKLTYTYEDMANPSGYNTYLHKGLPIGPGNMPSEKSIEAALYPANTNYYYFMADVCDKKSLETYFAESYAQHQQNINKYLTC
ncbi:MAG: endolytic transglycosylase MltG [Bacilli bacterium]